MDLSCVLLNSPSNTENFVLLNHNQRINPKSRSKNHQITIQKPSSAQSLRHILRRRQAAERQQLRGRAARAKGHAAAAELLKGPWWNDRNRGFSMAI